MSRTYRRSSIGGLLLIATLAVVVSCDQLLDPKRRAEEAARLQANTSLHAPRRGAIPDRYVVVLKEHARNPRQVARDLVVPAGGRIHHVYEHALKGFAMTLPSQALNGIRNHPSVADVVQDGMVHLIGAAAEEAIAASTQHGATWGLDRIDQRDLPLDGTFTYGATGAGVTAYIIDSGILATHEEFGGRASIGIDLVDDGQNGIDCIGHGTHVAGTIGGTTYGVAKQVNLVAVRVFGCDPSAPYSVVIAAVDWLTANATRPAVVNMSLGGAAFEPLNDAVRNSVLSGLVYAVAAGNERGADACMFSPAGTAEALTVGSMTRSDARSGFSNGGGCVDIFAPGSDITSTWHTSTTATHTISGTSMATPHIAGIAAVYLEGNPAASPDDVANAILGTATAGRLTDAGPGSPNLLLYAPLTPPASGPVIGLQPSALQINVFTFADGAAFTSAAPPGGAPRFAVHSSGQAAGKHFRAAAVGQPADGHASALTTESRSVLLSNFGNEALHWTAAPNAAWLAVRPAAGSLAAYDTTSLTVTVDPAGLGVGEHQAAITISDPAAANSPRTVNVALTVVTVVGLESGVPVTALSGVAGSRRLFRLHVPEGAGTLIFQTFGGAGDLDLFVRYGDLPDPFTGLFDCISAGWSNEESCMLMNPPAGDWFVLLYGYGDYADATLLASVADGSAVIGLWPSYLFFQQLIDPTTGNLVAAARPASRPDREELRARRTLAAATGGRMDASPRSFYPEQPVWLENPGTATLNWSAATEQTWLSVSPSAGALAPGSYEELLAGLNASGLSAGYHAATLTVAAPGALNSPQVVSVDLLVSQLGLLELDVPTDLPVGPGIYHLYFRVTSPDGLPALKVATSGATGNLAMFVRYGSPPDLWWGEYDCVSASSPTDEQCLIQNPAGGDWYILLYGPGTFEGVSLLVQAGEAAPVIHLSPTSLFFQGLTDPLTGAVVAAARPISMQDRDKLPSARTLTGGKSYTGVGSKDASPRSFDPEQPVRLGNTGAVDLNWTAASDQTWLAVSPSAGALEPANYAELTVGVNATGLAPGFHIGTLTIADPSAFNSPQTVWALLSISQLGLLELGVPRENMSGDRNVGLQYFRVKVPIGAQDLHITTSDGTGDLDLFVRRGSPPDLYSWEFDCVSGGWTNEESCSFPEPAAGDWYILIYPYAEFQGATLLATIRAEEWTIEKLAAEVQALQNAGVLAHGAARSLLSKLDEAIAARDRGNLEAARGSLGAFIHRVKALRQSRQLEPGAAEHLVAAAETLLHELGG